MLLIRSDLRRRWPTAVALSLLVGLSGAFVITAATGARRADTALVRFMDATKMWDGSLEVELPATEQVVQDVAAQPEVVAVSAAGFIPLISEEVETGVIAGLATGWLSDVYQPRILAGRLPDPNSIDELLINEEEAERHDLAPGDVVTLEDWLGLGIVQPMTIVGIHRGVLDLAVGDTVPGAIASEAFGRRYGPQFYDLLAGTRDAELTRTRVVARMRGAPERLSVLHEVAERHPDAQPQVVDRSEFVAPLERSVAVQVEAFWILAVVSALSAVLLLGVALARMATASAHSDETLRALGLPSLSRRRVSVAVPALVVAVGSGLALTGAAALSPVVPLGSARLLEPDPGVWVEASTSLAVGGLLAAGVAVIAALLVVLEGRAARLAPRRSSGTVRVPLRAALGYDLAYRTSSWGRLAWLSTCVGLGLVLSAAVYTASADRLTASPALFGSDYEVVVFPADGAAPGREFAALDVDHPVIESAAIARVAQVEVAGDQLEALVLDGVRGSAGGTILKGRAPQADDEVALGPATADRLGLEVGDEVVIVGSRSNAMRVVGETVLPIMGQGAYGDVMWLTDGAVDLVGIEPDEPRLLLHLAPGRTRHDLAVAVGDGGDDVPVPDNVSNLDGVGQIPLALALFGALLSAAVVAFALVGLVRRREDDLAILRTLGLRPRQVKGLVFAASLFIVGPGAAMAVAIGAVLGRAYWSAVAAGVPVLARPVVPLELSAVVVLGALAVGLVLAVGPAWLATRIRPAEVLQRD